ncbi:MAG TPA: SDR family oxidoreductase [Ramlibacter sp.]|nr:SDR family oxidoreductase [Ramlibacter sp.]
MEKNWKVTHIPSQLGRTAVVTGTGGLGFEDALALANAGASVVIAGRDAAKGAAAVERINRTVGRANATFEHLDLASLDSIRVFADTLRATRTQVDVLVNNAAVMTPPTRRETADGFELQFGTNFLGHFALTGQLLPLLRRSRRARVVSVSSVAARRGAIDLSDLQSQRRYDPMGAYGQSKLACLMFAIELQRRSAAAGWGIESMAAHPGISRTDLLPNGSGRRSIPGLLRRYAWFLFQPAAQGALPTLFAATSPEAQPGEYYGPDRLGELRGVPALARIPGQALDARMAERLWDEAEKLTSTSYAQPGVLA